METKEIKNPDSIRVSIIDDDDDVRNLFLNLLRRRGYEHVTAFSRGSDAVHAFEDNPNLADVVLIDYWMPEMDGVTTGAAIKKINPKVRLILVTAFELLPRESQVIFNEVLAKPVSSSKLISAVAEG